MPKLVKGDVLSKLEYQPFSNGCETSTGCLQRMTTVWPAPRHLYFVTLTLSAAVCTALWYSFPLSTTRPTGSMLCDRLLLVLSDVWQLNCFSGLAKTLSAANKQKSPKDSAGDYWQPDFTDVDNGVYYTGSKVTSRLITLGGTCRRGWLRGKGGGRRERLSHSFPSEEKARRYEGSDGGALRVWAKGRVYSCKLSIKGCHHQSQPFIMFVKSLISFLHRSNWLQMGSIPVLFREALSVLCLGIEVSYIHTDMSQCEIKASGLCDLIPLFCPTVVSHIRNKQRHLNVSVGSAGDENQDEFTCGPKTKSSIILSYKTGQKDHKPERNGFIHWLQQR